MSDKPILNLKYSENGTWERVGRPGGKMDSSVIEAELLILFPFCTFTNILKKSKQKKANIIFEQDYIELGDGDTLHIKDLVDDDFSMIYRVVSDRLQCVVINPPANPKFSDVHHFEKMAQIALFDNFHAQTDGGVYLISKQEDKYVEKNTYYINQDYSFPFNSQEILKSHKFPDSYNLLSDFSPFFQNVPTLELITELSRLFSDDLITNKGTTSTKSPSVEISAEHISYTNLQCKTILISKFNRNLVESVQKDLMELLSQHDYDDEQKQGHSSESQTHDSTAGQYKNSKEELTSNLQAANSNYGTKAKESDNNPQSGIRENTDVSTLTTKSELCTETQLNQENQTEQSPESDQMASSDLVEQTKSEDSGSLDGDFIDNKAGETINQQQLRIEGHGQICSCAESSDTFIEKKSTNRLLRDVYNVSVSKSKDVHEHGYLNFNINPKPDEPALKEKFNKPMKFREILNEMELAFPTGESYSYQDELIEFIIKEISVINLNLRSEERSGSEFSIWNVDISSQYSKSQNKIKEEELNIRKTSLDAKLKDFDSKKSDYQTKTRTLADIRRLLKLPEQDSDIIKSLDEFLREVDASKTKLSLLTEISSQIDSNQDSLNDKIRVLDKFISMNPQSGQNLSSISSENLQKLLQSYTVSIQKMQKITELRSFNNKTLPSFCEFFGDLEIAVKDAVQKLENSFQDVNQQFVISDAIRGKLSNPEERKKKLNEQILESINSELEKYKLRIEKPDIGAMADPSRHKVIGYETGIARGTVAAVISWGLVELREGKPAGNTIFKSEVKIYQ